MKKLTSRCCQGMLLLTLFLTRQSAAYAGTLHRVVDAHNDGYDRFASHAVTGSQSRFEIYDAEVMMTDEEVVVRVNSNLPLQGVGSAYAKDGHIGYGDLLIRSSTGEVYGVKYASNETSLPTGVYRNVTTRNAAGDNFGSRVDANNPAIATNMTTGERIGDVFAAQVEGTTATGTHRIVVSFPRHLLPEGDYTFTVIQECANDFVDIPVTVASTNQPSIDVPQTPISAVKGTVGDSSIGLPPVGSGHVGTLGAPSLKTTTNASLPSEAFIAIGGLGLLALILLLSGGGDSGSDTGSSDRVFSSASAQLASSSTEVTGSNDEEVDRDETRLSTSLSATTPSTTNQAQDVPEGGNVGGVLFFLLAAYFATRRITEQCQ